MNRTLKISLLSLGFLLLMFSTQLSLTEKDTTYASQEKLRSFWLQSGQEYHCEPQDINCLLEKQNCEGTRPPELCDSNTGTNPTCNVNDGGTKACTWICKKQGETDNYAWQVFIECSRPACNVAGTGCALPSPSFEVLD